MERKNSNSKKKKTSEASIRTPEPKAIVAAIKRGALAEKKEWPLDIRYHNITPQAYAQAVTMDVRALLSTGMTWVTLKKIVSEFQGKDVGVDWPETYRRACRLAYYSLGLIKWKKTDDTYTDDFDDWDGKYVIDAKAYALWEIEPPSKKQETKVTDKKTTAKNGNGNGNGNENGKKKQAKQAKQPKQPKQASGILTERDHGYLIGTYEAISDLSAALDSRAKNSSALKEAKQHLEDARNALYLVLPEDYKS